MCKVLRCDKLKYSILALLSMVAMDSVRADDRPYLCEWGIQAGCGYYAGDATQHVFQNVRETYGAHFRYKFTPRWALQVKGLYHRIAGPMCDIEGEFTDDLWENNMINLDVLAEFNFFRMGARTYDKRVKQLSPYLFAGFGTSLYGDKYRKVGVYIPVGFGLKWKCSEHFGLNIAWQHNIYTTDNIECVDVYDNTYQLNGSNWLNCDITSQLTLGMIIEFGKAKKVCRHCWY